MTQEVITRRRPLNGTFELTLRCNLHCRMCLFRHKDSENEALRARELSAGAWIDLAQQAAELGTFSILITGGEPLLRPDFSEIWEGIYRKGFMTELYTNATLVTPQIMKTLKKCPPHRIGITVYGASEETYEKVCGSADAYNRMMEGADLLTELPSRVRFRTTLIRDNAGELSEMERLIKERYDRPLTMTRMVTGPVRGGAADVRSCRLGARENAEIIAGRKHMIIDEKVSSEGPVAEKKAEGYLLGCHAGIDQYTITNDGKLLGCQMLDKFATDALREGLKKAWEIWPETLTERKQNVFCKSCPYRGACLDCYAYRLAETGGLTDRPAYICEDAALMNRMRGGKECIV